MFTYRQNRVFFMEEGRLEFPCRVRVNIRLDPNPAFGDSVPGMTVPTNSTGHMTWNANTGRSLVECDQPLPPCDVAATIDGIDIRIDGGTIVAEWECTDRAGLVGTLGALHFVLPLSLGLELLDPAVVATTSGTAGDAKFVWQVAQTKGQFEVVDAEDRDVRCRRAIECLPVLCDPKNARLLAASAYFRQSDRLIAVGNGPSEFAGEAVINLAKVLEVLFPGKPDRTREAVRAGLDQLGYGADEVEGFISCLVVRSSLDAAHVRMATLANDERQHLQAFLERILGSFRRLMTDIVKGVLDGTFTLASYEAERADGDDLSKLISRLPVE